ncbi:MAG: hypothetical protein AAF539_11990, partial [Planctomycetota bacterium]
MIHAGRRFPPMSSLLPVIMLLAVCFIYAGDPPPAVNEAHYLVKAKNFWQPQWCQNDLFAASGKAHWLFYVVFGWPTQLVSLTTTAWIGRGVGWTLIACGWTTLGRTLELSDRTIVAAFLIWLAGIEYANLAGEWVVGGIEAKVPAYGLVLFGLSDLLRNRWRRVWIWFGAAAAFHVLTGGWSVVAAMIAYGIRYQPWRGGHPRPTFFSKELFIGGSLSLVGLVPPLAMNWEATDSETNAAARTYAYFRISHHLTPAAFHLSWYLRHFGLVVLTAATVIVWRRQAKADHPLHRLVAFGLGAFAITTAGLIVGILPAIAPDFAAKLLRLYWFRLGDGMVPMILALTLAVLACE